MGSVTFLGTFTQGGLNPKDGDGMWAPNVSSSLISYSSTIVVGTTVHSIWTGRFFRVTSVNGAPEDGMISHSPTYFSRPVAVITMS